MTYSVSRWLGTPDHLVLTMADTGEIISTASTYRVSQKPTMEKSDEAIRTRLARGQGLPDNVSPDAADILRITDSKISGMQFGLLSFG